MITRGFVEVTVRMVMDLCHGVATKVKVGSELLEEFWVEVGVHQRSMLLLPPLAIAMNIILMN